MHQRVSRDDRHLVSAETGRKDEPEDLWFFHEAGDRRQVFTVLALCLYAASPSTEEVVFFCKPLSEIRPHLLVPVEVRAYGGGCFVWLEVSETLSFFDNQMLAGLAVEMNKVGKLTVY